MQSFSPPPRPAVRWQQDRLRDVAFTLSLQQTRHLTCNRRYIDANAMASLSSTLFAEFFGSDVRYVNTPEGAKEYHDHLTDRLHDDRRRVVPWLDSIRPLKGMRILEIGCGTGSSTVAFAEQGADVVGLDIDDRALAVAQQRLELYGLTEAQLLHGNALDHAVASEKSFDLIMFFASLEHMLHSERLEALRRMWAALGRGGLLAVVECPNRLWFFDGHTAQLPFFHWLPDELALAYAKHSPRRELRERFADPHPLDMLPFLRKGRGVSYHEFHLALGELAHLEIAGSLEEFLRRNFPVFWLRDRMTTAPSYRRVLRRLAPEVPAAFLELSLGVVLRKS